MRAVSETPALAVCVRVGASAKDATAKGKKIGVSYAVAGKNVLDVLGLEYVGVVTVWGVVAPATDPVGSDVRFLSNTSSLVLTD